MSRACVYFHQGWSDIVNCLSLINYYTRFYNQVVVLIRSDAKDLVDFYTRNLQGVSVVYIETDNGRFYGSIRKTNCSNVEYSSDDGITIPLDFKLLFHAEHDSYREDEYKGYWRKTIKKPTKHFVESFYTYYNVPYSTRINSFTLDRNHTIEDKVYSEFVHNNSTKYVLYHDDSTNHKNGSYHISTKIQLSKHIEGYKYVNLHRLSSTFFDFIKVLENAEELHLIDSVWASLCYQLDAKYGLLSSKAVKLYNMRGQKEMFLNPVTLSNWEIIK